MIYPPMLEMVSLSTDFPSSLTVLTERGCTSLRKSRLTVLNISIGTVKSRIARGREDLREKMGKEFQ